MRMSLKIVSGLVAAGVVATASSAFTATGLTATGTANAAQFVGGTVSQAVTGATIDSIVYSYANATTKTHVNSIALGFATTADGRTVGAVPTGGSGGTFTCTAVSSNASTCTFVPTTAEVGYVGLTSLAVTVS